MFFGRIWFFDIPERGRDTTDAWDAAFPFIQEHAFFYSEKAKTAYFHSDKHLEKLNIIRRELGVPSRIGILEKDLATLRKVPREVVDELCKFARLTSEQRDRLVKAFQAPNVVRD